MKENILDVNTGESFIVNKGYNLRVSAESIVDMVVYNFDNLEERFDQARTKACQSKIFVSAGDFLYSKFSRVMMSIIKDTYKGKHDLQYGMCSKYSLDLYWELREKDPSMKKYFDRHGISKRDDLPDHGCWENLAGALEKYNIKAVDIPSPLNIFQNIDIDANTGIMTWELDKVRPEPGKPAYVEFQAEMNCLVALSVCPERGKGGKARPAKVQIFKD